MSSVNVWCAVFQPSREKLTWIKYGHAWIWICISRQPNPSPCPTALFMPHRPAAPWHHYPQMPDPRSARTGAAMECAEECLFVSACGLCRIALFVSCPSVFWKWIPVFSEMFLYSLFSIVFSASISSFFFDQAVFYNAVKVFVDSVIQCLSLK